MEDAFTDDPEQRKLWVQQISQVLEILREWRQTGEVVNINCQMGKNRSGAAVLIWLCKEEGWSLEDAVEHLRAMNPLACANPHLVEAVAELVNEAKQIPLNPAGDGGGWICISPPGSPRIGGAEDFENSAQEALASLAGLAADKLAAGAEESEEEAADGDMGALFDGIDS